jgi:threonine dehydrogenase-like Zn-dependent dehydrogenase
LTPRHLRSIHCDYGPPHYAPPCSPATSPGGQCSSSAAVRSGSLCCRLARHFGAGRVYLSEPSAERRSYAEATEVDRAFDPSVDAADIERLKADAVLEYSGVESGLTAALRAARPEGIVVVVGGGRAGLDPLTILLKELRVQGSFSMSTTSPR